MLIVLGEERHTLQWAKTRCREILRATPKGGEIQGVAACFLFDVLLRHPKANEKVGIGVRRFFRSGSGFWLERTDGTKTDFSFLKCLGSRTHRAEVLSAMRAAIEGQVT